MSVPTVYVVYYSMYGHVKTLAKEVMSGLQKTGVNAKLFQIAETLPQEVLAKMHAPPKDADVPVITAAQLAEADGVLFGIPTRFGTVPAQVKTLFDACGQLWFTGGLYGKFAGTFFSTAGLGGGQETTALSSIPFFTHQGMIYVPFGYKNKNLSNITEVHGGSAYGAGTVSGSDGARQPSELELDLAQSQGFEFGSLLKRVNRA